jgi:hypothetical protein
VLPEEAAIGIAGGDAFQHFHLTRREQVVGHVRGQLVGDFARDEAATRVPRPDRLEKIRAEGALEKIPDGAGLERTKCLRIALVGREDDHSRVRPFLADRGRGRDAVHLRHLQIHQGHALLGPGAYSLDSRLFGRRKLIVHGRGDDSRGK